MLVRTFPTLIGVGRLMSKSDEFMYTKEQLLELAETDQRLADVLLIDDQNFDPNRFLAASVLIMTLRWFQDMEKRGVSFSKMSPELIVELIKNGEPAIEAVPTKIATQQVAATDGPTSGGPSLAGARRG